MSVDIKEIWAKAAAPPGEENLSSGFDPSKIRSQATDVAGRFLFYLKLESYFTLAILPVIFYLMWDVALLTSIMLMPYYWDVFRIMKLMRNVRHEQDTKTFISNLLGAFEGFAKRYVYLIVLITPFYFLLAMLIQWRHLGAVNITPKLAALCIISGIVAMGLSSLYYHFVYKKRILALRAMQNDLIS